VLVPKALRAVEPVAWDTGRGAPVFLSFFRTFKRVLLRFVNLPFGILYARALYSKYVHNTNSKSHSATNSLHWCPPTTVLPGLEAVTGPCFDSHSHSTSWGTISARSQPISLAKEVNMASASGVFLKANIIPDSISGLGSNPGGVLKYA
jgi:hypothetical protein